jgi:large subunit ribosomal protein L24
MSKLNIKKGDTVLVTAGKENGKVSTVLECFPEEGKATVRGLNIITKHNKPRSAQDKGGIVKKEGKIDASNLMVVCPACDKATRVKMGVNDKGEKVRLCKHCGASLDSGVKKAQEKKASKTADKKTDEAKPKAEKKSPAKKTEKTEKSSKENEVGGTNG